MMKIVGYTDQWSVEPDGKIRFMVSTEAKRYRADLVRLWHGDPNPAGPGFKTEPVPSSISSEYAGRVQRIRSGSYVRVPHDSRLELRGGFTLDCWIYPTTPRKDRQALICKRGAFELALLAGHLQLTVGEQLVRLALPVERGIWYAVSAQYDCELGEVKLSLQPLVRTAWQFAASETVQVGDVQLQPSTSALLIAAAEGDDGPTDFYNGKLEAPRIAAGGKLVASWDFSADIPSRRVRDVSGNGIDGQTVNMPTRAATGHNWDGSEFAWPHAPEQYGAIHFHDDDLDDAGWDVDFEWQVPAEARSGVYAVRLQAAGEEDYIPFFVRPKRGRPTAKIVFLAPLFSYLAYANEQFCGRIKAKIARRLGEAPIGAALRDFPSTAQERYRVENRLLSLYDSHSDGSGVCYSSWLRPLVNMRPDSLLTYQNFGGGSPHQLSADLCLVDWLHEQSYEFDVVTDEDLHREGRELLAPYRVVLTGTHAEYWSSEMLDAMGDYLAGGGKLMYLSGNGMCCNTQLDPEEGHTVEMRRFGVHTQWFGDPGERHFSTTGARSGLWRDGGRPEHGLIGVGFASAGSGPGRPYERQSGSFDPHVSFIFEGLGADELIGDFPSLINGHGAAAYEIDRLNFDLGTPHHTILLASATSFAADYSNGLPEWSYADGQSGPGTEPPVRADMVYVDYPKGGAVFSVSSIGWCGCLSYNNYDNNVSRITRNVLDRFSRTASAK